MSFFKTTLLRTLRYWGLVYLPAAIIGCTAATPNVSALGSNVLLSSKSPSPWEQENDGDTLRFYGQCVGLIETFEFRVDENLVWTSIPPTPPSPSGMSEYLVGNPEYDVDCSDGDYDFYVFMNQVQTNILALYSAPNTPPAVSADDYEPYRVEVRGRSSIGNIVPSLITMIRPQPVRLKLDAGYGDSYSFGNWFVGFLNLNVPLRFEVSLLSETGHEVLPYLNNISVQLSAINLTSGSPISGNFFTTISDCNTPVSAADLEFVINVDRRKNYCFVPASPLVALNDVRIIASANLMYSDQKDFKILGTDDVINQLSPGNDFNDEQYLPSHLVKNATYKLNKRFMVYENPLFPGFYRQVKSLTGTHTLTSNSHVSFQWDSSLNNCPEMAQSGGHSCNVTFETSLPFFLTPLASHPAGPMNLNLGASKDLACANCIISNGDTNSNSNFDDDNTLIQQILPINRMFQVVDGPINYSRPTLSSDQGRLRPANCHRLNISLANANGHTLPAPANARTVMLNSQTGFEFYQNRNCDTFGNLGFNGSVYKMAVRPDGKILVVGYFSTYNGQPRNRIALINADGSLVHSFQPPSNTFTGDIFDILPLPDGRTLLAGSFVNFSGASSNSYLVMLNERGQVDPSFQFRPTGAVYTMARDPENGRIYFGGQFYSLDGFVGGDARAKFFAIDPNPTDPRFFTLNSQSLNVQNTSARILKILVAGNHVYFGGEQIVTTNAIATGNLFRINKANGSLDSTWVSSLNTPDGPIYEITFDSINSRIFVAGDFVDLVSNAGYSNFISYNLDGSIGSFALNTDGVIKSLHIVGDSLYLAGNFNSVNGNARRALAKVSISTQTVDGWVTASSAAGFHSLAITHEAVFISGDFIALQASLSANQIAKLDSTNANLLPHFNQNNSTRISVSFSPYDLIKPVYIRMNVPSHSGQLPISYNDGMGSDFNLNLSIENPSP